VFGLEGSASFSFFFQYAHFSSWPSASPLFLLFYSCDRSALTSLVSSYTLRRAFTSDQDVVFASSISPIVPGLGIAPGTFAAPFASRIRAGSSPSPYQEFSLPDALSLFFPLNSPSISWPPSRSALDSFAWAYYFFFPRLSQHEPCWQSSLLCVNADPCPPASDFSFPCIKAEMALFFFPYKCFGCELRRCLFAETRNALPLLPR